MYARTLSHHTHKQELIKLFLKNEKKKGKAYEEPEGRGGMVVAQTDREQCSYVTDADVISYEGYARCVLHPLG